MAADRAPSGTGHDTAEPIFPGCKRPVSECRAEDVDDPLFSVPADPVVSPADTREAIERAEEWVGEFRDTWDWPRDPITREVDAAAAWTTLDEAVTLAEEMTALAAALLAVGERDRQHIAQLTEAAELAAEKIEYAQETATGWLTYRAAMQDALAYLRAVLADKEDAECRCTQSMQGCPVHDPRAAGEGDT